MRIDKIFNNLYHVSLNHMGVPGPWPPPPPLRSDQDRKPPPYQPLYCHYYWFIDIRYLVKLEGQWVYSLCIVEGYSRKILAGMASDYQNELAVLPFPRTVNQHGCVSVQGFYIYAERGLAKHGVAVWKYDEAWLKVRPRPHYTPRKPKVPLPRQPLLLGLEFVL